MHCTIIVGSQNKDSQSLKVGIFCQAQLRSLGMNVDIVELGVNPLPYHSDENNPDTESGKATWTDLSKTLKGSDSILVISPERGGMVPGVLKNFFLRCNDGELAHKPGLLIGVSSGTGGSYPIAELRMSSYKNTKICYIPDHVIVRDVNNVLNGDGIENSVRIEKRIINSLKTLLAYTKGFDLIRQEEVIQENPMPYGM